MWTFLSVDAEQQDDTTNEKSLADWLKNVYLHEYWIDFLFHDKLFGFTYLHVVSFCMTESILRYW